MKIKAAVLNKMGLEAPYAKSKPLAIEELELDPPGHGEVLVKIARRRVLPFRSLGDRGNRPRPTPMVAWPRSCGRGRKGRPRGR